MNSTDRKLGMNRPISRRDVIHGIGTLSAAALATTSTAPVFASNTHVHVAQLDYPVSLGDYASTSGPDQPVIIAMFRYPHTNNQGLTAKEQYRLARHDLLTTSFETIERNVRIQLASILGSAGFDPARDISGITVNRWAHGYAYDKSSHALFDQLYDDDEDARYPHMLARKPFERITVANADSAASAMLEAAIEQGHRAVTELPG
ncbi:MAG: hypothetical protein ABGY96_15890 [bacterium]|nr:hypothetical protein [Gammaproteobacteria bacterium]